MRKKIKAEIMAEVLAENTKKLEVKVITLRAFLYEYISPDVLNEHQLLPE